MKTNFSKLFRIWIYIACALLSACDDLEDQPSQPIINGGNLNETGTSELYILSEGLFNLNNSSLARYSFKNGQLDKNYFLGINKRGLGDTANDMAIYGSKLFHRGFAKVGQIFVLRIALYTK